MGCAEGVVCALATLGKTRQAPALAQGTDAVATSGQDLVRVGLMAHVPDQDVLRRFIDMMQRDRQFDHTQTRAQMPTGLRHCIDGFRPQLIGQLSQLRNGKVAGVGRRGNRVEKGCFWRH